MLLKRRTKKKLIAVGMVFTVFFVLAVANSGAFNAIGVPFRFFLAAFGLGR